MTLGRRIVYAKLHETVHLPNTGNLSDTLPPSMKQFDLKMFHTNEGLFLQVNGVEAVVPWANVKIAQYAPEEKVKSQVLQAVA